MEATEERSKSTSKSKTKPSAREEQDIALINRDRYEYVRMRGHLTFCQTARRNENFYLGDGLQWDPDDRKVLEDAGRKPFEFNEIMEAVNTALGFQLQNRVDIAFQPRGKGAREDVSKTLSKVAMQIADNNQFDWVESQVFADGLIQTRGFYEMRMDFDDSLQGEIRITALDPMDVIPDPDAKSYDPDDWADVVVTRWLTLDEIEGLYGEKKRKELEQGFGVIDDRDFGDDSDELPRNKFGDDDIAINPTYYDTYRREGHVVRARIIDRQHWRITQSKIAVFPTGDIRKIDNLSPEQVERMVHQQGAMVLSKPMNRVRWTVSCHDTLLHDDWSPYEHFTIVPYFPIFRRGRTRGMVDNAIGPQEMGNKAVSQFIHIINSTANGGWLVEADSLVNMDVDDLQDEGAKTGLVIEYNKNSQKPEKIKPNEIPRGVENLMLIGFDKIKSITGQTNAMRGQGGEQQSGIAIQAQQFGAQLSMGPMLDNLSRTRHLLAKRMLKLIQTYMDDPRIMRIEEPDNKGGTVHNELQLNWPTADELLNDLTLGEYAVVITEQPSHVTFENSQYEQSMEMREKGIAIPDDIVIRHSNLADKSEVIDRLKEQAEAQDPAAVAAAALAEAQAISKRVEALFSAMRTAQLLSTNPAMAAVADTIVKSAGFQDQDQAPIYPGDAPPGEAPPDNTNPITPDNPAVGVKSGIENGQPEPLT